MNVSSFLPKAPWNTPDGDYKGGVEGLKLELIGGEVVGLLGVRSAAQMHPWSLRAQCAVVGAVAGAAIVGFGDFFHNGPTDCRSGS